MSLSITRGRKAVFSITVTQDGVALNLTGKHLTFCAKRRITDADADAAFIITSQGGGIVIDAGAGGTATMTVSAANTTGLSKRAVTKLEWELALLDGTDPYKLTGDVLEVEGNVADTVS